MAFGKWKSIGIVVELPNGERYILPNNKGGRLLYEEFDNVTSKSNENSRFFEVKTLNLLPKVPEDDEGIEGHLKLNLSDDSVEELIEDA